MMCWQKCRPRPTLGRRKRRAAHRIFFTQCRTKAPTRQCTGGEARQQIFCSHSPQPHCAPYPPLNATHSTAAA
jgi:hypothetical protein